jgi:hypothetical protein
LAKSIVNLFFTDIIALQSSNAQNMQEICRFCFEEYGNKIVTSVWNHGGQKKWSGGFFKVCMSFVRKNASSFYNYATTFLQKQKEEQT